MKKDYDDSTFVFVVVIILFIIAKAFSPTGDRRNYIPYNERPTTQGDQ